jgi:RHS repeat-associated protein
VTNYINPEGQRLAKAGGVAGTIYFAPDPDGGLAAEDDNGAWIDYIWLNGRLIGRIASNQLYAVHADQLGRPEVVTNSARNAVWQARNFAFDRTVTQNTIGGLNIGFPGQYYDAETATWNNGFRDFNSDLGRYLESDPTGLLGGVNSFIYALGNPIANIDPLGLWPFGMPGKSQARNQLPGVLLQLVPSLTHDESDRIAEDAIGALSWGDVLALKSVTPNIKNATMPSSFAELSPQQIILLVKFLNKLPDKDKSAIKKILEKISQECPQK